MLSKYLECIVWLCHKARVWQTDRRTDRKNYDSRDRASIAVRAVKRTILYLDGFYRSWWATWQPISANLTLISANINVFLLPCDTWWIKITFKVQGNVCHASHTGIVNTDSGKTDHGDRTPVCLSRHHYRTRQLIGATYVSSCWRQVERQPRCRTTTWKYKHCSGLGVRSVRTDCGWKRNKTVCTIFSLISILEFFQSKMK